ncbi:unnamed protein product [Schistocephalus solidus]|uniref:Uncharacterized protein n=1 Tax=Schistocephalus solidus TaxID=70667 RepID=A0A183T7V2_SCHSO|nr:unnamed protein product [Schistocephalus solidus]
MPPQNTKTEMARQDPGHGSPGDVRNPQHPRHAEDNATAMERQPGATDQNGNWRATRWTLLLSVKPDSSANVCGKPYSADHHLLLPPDAAKGDLGTTRSRHWHLLDFFLVRRRDKEDVLVTKAIFGAEGWTGHHLVISKMMLRL